MTEHYYAVILAGGGGTRLWPLSRRSQPKQMLRLNGELTLFQMAVRRLSALFPPERILVVTNQAQSAGLKEQCPELGADNFLLEPEPRGTAAAIGLAAMHLHMQDPEAIMAVLTADHYIAEQERLLGYLRRAKEIAAQGHLVTLGIDPTQPATQYGYIEHGEPLDGDESNGAYLVKRFKEKPDLAEAERMLAAGGHSWNSGMFIWQVVSIRNEFERLMPRMHKALGEIEALGGTQGDEAKFKAYWETIPYQTIDYGVMEHAERVAVIPVKGMGWNDVGSWSSLFEVFAPDGDGNVLLIDKGVTIETRNSIVHATERRVGKDRLLVTIGVEDLVVVDTGDVLFICPRARAQEVRQVIEQLKKQGLEDYL
jgi:mannose-1-phosphate guanylyltransferase